MAPATLPSVVGPFEQKSYLIVPSGYAKTSFLMAKRVQADHHSLLDLVKVLQPQSSGLRRWSIACTMREDHDVAEITLPQKFEHAVERVLPQPLRSFGIFQEAQDGGGKGTALLAAGKGSLFMGGLT